VRALTRCWLENTQGLVEVEEGEKLAELASEQGFPRPRHRADGTRVWRADVIERWADRHWWDSKPWRKPSRVLRA